MKCTGFVICLCMYWTIPGAFTYPPKKPVAYTKYGPVVGSVETSRNLREYRSFRGIPYAKPPIGNLRFANPEPPDPWTFPINGTKDGPYCIQKNYFFANPVVEGQEDCLYLNVYVPVLNKTDSELLPVMVFIHWGGFLAGRATSDYLGPEYLMDKDVILVTFNYRLGVFGFMTTLDDNAPGNFGLKDQVLALKFVQDNIEFFGGNKSRVTLFGQSAGSGSVSLHLVSPSSKGLFQQAISQSGVALNLWAKPLNILQPNVTGALASFVGCTESLGDNEKLVACLRNVEANDLAESAEKFKFFSVEPLTPYTIVTEKLSPKNPYPFLTKDPYEYFQAGEFQKVPYIVGMVQDEGILRAAPLLRQPETREALNANFKTLFPQLLLLSLSTGPNTSSLFDNITNFYLNGSGFIDVNNPEVVQGFIDIYTDRSFVYGIYQSIILQSQKGHRPIWVYNFNYRGQHSYGDKFAATSNDINFEWGVSHCDDLLYLFRSPALFPDLENPSDLLMSEHLTAAWTNFAINGNPNPYKDTRWRPLRFKEIEDIKNQNIRFLNITGSQDSLSLNFQLQTGLYPERMKFWINQNVNENFPGLA